MKSNYIIRIYAAKICIFWVTAKDFTKIIWIFAKNAIPLHRNYDILAISDHQYTSYAEIFFVTGIYLKYVRAWKKQ